MGTVARFLFAVTALSCMIYAVYLELARCPKPQAEHSKGVDKYVGKAIFLTVQSVFILTGYYFLCAVSEGAKLCGSEIKFLERITHKYSSVAGGFALFLTIMFYALCWSAKLSNILNSVQNKYTMRPIRLLP